MSQNRAVQAAQRRRAGGPEPAAPGRGPQPSINSSQMFSQGQGQQQQAQGQIRPGTTGRLAGQQAQLQQQQMMQQQQQHQESPAGISGVNKMTLAQAITLITLRLGKVETHLNEKEMTNSNIDSGIIDVILSRLDTLESQPVQTQGTTSSTSETIALKQNVDLLKQQVDTFKPLLTQSKSAIAILTNEQKLLKQEIETLKAELSALQKLTMDNSQQILKISLNDINDSGETDDTNIVEDDSTEFVGTDLKVLIEQELNN
uniref:Uncharacterized protein n=1 Tax=viral metagenome TaxID=1070528 RepID=A0A6C0I784_9ZZZZ